MSWQQYVDDHLLIELPGNRKLKSAAIVGMDGSIWAQSDDFPEVTEEQIDTIVKGLEDASIIQEKGIEIGDIKFVAIQGEPGTVLRGKQKSSGITIKKTETAIVIGIYGEGVMAGECNVIVENLADYLIEQGV